jgi:hypothetical protein
MALVPIVGFIGWVVFCLVRRRLSESALYAALDVSLYLSAAAAVVLVVIPICFRKSVSMVRLVTVSLFCGLILAFLTFVGYMTIGFG